MKVKLQDSFEPKVEWTKTFGRWRRVSKHSCRKDGSTATRPSIAARVARRRAANKVGAVSRRRNRAA